MKKLWSILSSRYFIATCFILLEVAEIFLVFTLMYNYAWSVLGFSLLVSYMGFLNVINSDLFPEGKMTWIAVILGLQPFGTVLYMIFGKRRYTRRDRRYYAEIGSADKEYLKIENGAMDELRGESEVAWQCALQLCHDSHSILHRNTVSKYYALGDDFFPDLLRDLRKAKSFVFMEYFIIEEGVMWNSVLDILKEKVKEGVEVRVLYDDIGCLRKLPQDYYLKLRKYGIRANVFAKYIGKANSSHNNRSHRKITVIDGVTAYTGGVNLADEYINRVDRFGHWKDTAIRLRGSAVNSLTHLFLTDWDLSNHRASNHEHFFVEHEPKAAAMGYYLPFGDGPEPFYTESAAKNMFLNMIYQARDYIDITTPYLIIDSELTNALQSAARRGVRVSIITPHVPDKRIIFWMTRSAYRSLISAGVNIYEYAPGFIHAKTFISDDEYAVCGTINFDYRSFVHHYENAVWMYKTDSVYSMKDDIEKTKKASYKVQEGYVKFNFIQAMILRTLKLFAPLL